MDSTVRGFKMWPLAVLTDDRINKGFLQVNIRQLSQAGKSGHNNNAIELLRWPLGRVLLDISATVF